MSRVWFLGLVVCLMSGLIASETNRLHAADDPTPLTVEPAELARRPELIGREILVDDRIRYFLETKRGQGFDELILKRTDVPCRLLAGSRFARPPVEPNAVVRGTLKLIEGRLICEVLTLELQPNDLERLDREISRIRPDDFAAKRGWAFWAERRGHELNDPKLEAKGTTLEADALWVQAGRPGADALVLAQSSVDRPIPTELRDALFLRGFLKAAATASTAAACADLARRVQVVFPQAVEPRPGTGPSIPPGEDSALVYRKATAPERAQMTRQLYANLIEKSLSARLVEDPAQAVTLVEEASRLLPDRPSLADQFRQRGLAEAERGVTSMRQAQVEELAQTLRTAGQPDRARLVLEEWLADRRRNRLSATDAEGRVLLAGNYEKLLNDRSTAGELLNEADKIDPASRAVADAFLRLGYRKGDAGWFDPTSTTVPEGSRPTSSPPYPTPTATESENSLRGLTQAQARSRMGGKPDRIVRSATQGMTIEQWVYRTGKVDQYILFKIDAATTEPRVTSTYSIPQPPNRP